MLRIARFKMISCAALLLSSGIAQAQSSVTLYGILDGGLLYTSKTRNTAGQNAGATLGVIDSGLTPSQFGIKGTEDLGDGLKADFDLESGISVANGGFNNSNGNFFGRQAWVGLDSNFGDIKAGLQYSPFFWSIVYSDPRGFSQFGSGLLPYGDDPLMTGAECSNALSYTSPNLAGFTGSVMIALGGTAGDFQAGRQYSANLKYENAGLMVTAAIFDGNSGAAIQTPIPSAQAFVGRTLGVAYTFGNLTASASFANYNVAGAFDNNVYGGGLDYRMQSDLDLNAGVWVTSDRDDAASHSLLTAVGANYYLSKATTLYAQVAVVNNHGMMDTGLFASPTALTGVQGTTVGVDIGVRHTF